MTDYSDNFERLWKVYPKRNGKKVGKRPAFNQWNKLTADERRAAYNDVEKRTRNKAWGKFIRDAQRYLRDHGWEDEWDLPQQDLVNKMPEVKDDGPQLPWMERVLNRLGKAYILTAMGLPDVKKALSIKHELLNVEWPALREDIDAEVETVESAAKVMMNLFLSRLDHAYGLSIKNKTLRLALTDRRAWRQ